MISEIILKMMQYFDGDTRRINHALKVFSFAKTMGELEKLSDEKQMTLEVAGVLHDIGIKQAEIKYNSSAGKYQELEGPEVAREILVPFNLDENQLSRIEYLIGHHHSYNKVDGMDFQILIEADFLVNIYEDEMNINQIKSIKEKYFKTETGIKMIEACYGNV